LRAAFTAQSREVDLLGRIHSDIFFQSRYVLNEVNVKIKLTRSRDAFCLIASGDQSFKVKIGLTAAAMIVRKVKVSPSVYLAHAKTLETFLAKYPLKRAICKAFTIPAGYLDSSQEKLFSGQLPTRLIVGCVDNRADRNRNVAFDFNNNIDYNEY
jgi:hypothetical protein